MIITIGSLFDGIGGFPEAGRRLDMGTIWASEIDPFCIKVTKLRRPEIEHVGDITKLKGTELTPVHIITGGSPCQDLSVAGRRAGLSGERSGLFMEQIRIINEMREATNGEYPRYMLWENVPGAFSSNKGDDFRVVLEETAKIADPTVIIPRPPKGKWATAGCILGVGWSIAWRVLDAQYWGVPQRRRRIFLVADFGGESAPEVLFKRQGLSRHSQEGGETKERVTTNAERGTRNTECYPINTQTITRHNALGERTGFGLGADGDPAYTLQAGHEHGVAIAIDSNCQDSRFKLTGDISPTIPAKMGTGGNNGPMLAIPINDKATRHKGGGESRKNDGSGNGLGIGKPGDPCPTLTVGDKHAVCAGFSYKASTGAGTVGFEKEKAPSLLANRHDASVLCAGFNGYKSVTGSIQYQEDKAATLEANMPGNVISCTPSGISGTVSSKWAKGTGGPAGDEHYNLITQPFPEDKAHCLSRQPQLRHRDDMDNLVVSGLDIRNLKENGDISGTLQAKKTGGYSLNYTHPVRQHYSVRRLTPLECERLQDFLDGWTDIPGASDSARYKALGNSVAICCPEHVLGGDKGGICKRMVIEVAQNSIHIATHEMG